MKVSRVKKKQPNTVRPGTPKTLVEPMKWHQEAHLRQRSGPRTPKSGACRIHRNPLPNQWETNGPNGRIVCGSVGTLPPSTEKHG